MMRLTKKLELKVSGFLLKKIINFKVNSKTREYEFRGMDRRGVPYSFFYEVRVTND